MSQRDFLKKTARGIQLNKSPVDFANDLLDQKNLSQNQLFDEVAQYLDHNPGKLLELKDALSQSRFERELTNQQKLGETFDIAIKQATAESARFRKQFEEIFPSNNAVDMSGHNIQPTNTLRASVQDNTTPENQQMAEAARETEEALGQQDIVPAIGEPQPIELNVRYGPVDIEQPSARAPRHEPAAGEQPAEVEPKQTSVQDQETLEALRQANNRVAPEAQAPTPNVDATLAKSQHAHLQGRFVAADPRRFITDIEEDISERLANKRTFHVKETFAALKDNLRATNQFKEPGNLENRVAQSPKDILDDIREGNTVYAEDFKELRAFFQKHFDITNKDQKEEILNGLADAAPTKMLGRVNPFPMLGKLMPDNSASIGLGPTSMRLGKAIDMEFEGKPFRAGLEKLGSGTAYGALAAGGLAVAAYFTPSDVPFIEDSGVQGDSVMQFATASYLRKFGEEGLAEKIADAELQKQALEDGSLTRSDPNYDAELAKHEIDRGSWDGKVQENLLFGVRKSSSEITETTTQLAAESEARVNLVNKQVNETFRAGNLQMSASDTSINQSMLRSSLRARIDKAKVGPVISELSELAEQFDRNGKRGLDEQEAKNLMLSKEFDSISTKYEIRPSHLEISLKNSLDM